MKKQSQEERRQLLGNNAVLKEPRSPYTKPQRAHGAQGMHTSGGKSRRPRRISSLLLPGTNASLIYLNPQEMDEAKPELAELEGDLKLQGRSQSSASPHH
jgi:hypothetical protein